jgi:hypothetical protein
MLVLFTMTDPQPVTSLEIIGYANRLSPSMLPTVVAPIFRGKAEPKQILLPPFAIHEGLVCNAQYKTSADLTKLDDEGEITLFDSPRDARPNFELWIDEAEAVHYEPIPDAALALRKIATRNIGLAQAALAEGRYEEAEKHCRIALCADDRLIEPLAISAAIARRKNDPGGERTMASLAAERVTRSGFTLMVDGFSAQLPPPAAEDAEDRSGRRPMRGIAALPAAA